MPSPALLAAWGALVLLLLLAGGAAAADEAGGRRSDMEGILVAPAGFAPCCCCCCMAGMFPAVCPAGTSCAAHAWLAEVPAAAAGSAVVAVGTAKLSLVACLGSVGMLLLLPGAAWLLLLLLWLLGVLPFRSATARENRGPSGILCAGGRAVCLLLPKLLLRDAAALFVKDEVPEEVPDTVPASAAGEDVAGSGDALDALSALCCCAGKACSESRSAAEDALLLGLEQHR